MASEGLVVGVDVATAEVRAVAADSLGRAVATARSPLADPSATRPGWSEQDAASWWPAVAAALAQVTDRLGGQRQSVAAVSVSATSGTVVALDEHGTPLTPALTYADQRAVAEAETAQAAATERWASLGLHIRPSFGLAKWGWLVASAGGRIRRLAHASDVVVEHLLGEPPPTDWSHALKSGYDPLRREWASEALDALGIPPAALPRVLPPATSAGVVCPEASRATGLPPGCVVRLGMTDACASQLAAGAGVPGRFVSVLGSTLVLKGATHDLVTDPAGAVYSHRHPQGWWLPGGASSTGARALTTTYAAADLSGLDAAAARHGPASAVVYPLVGRGERFPFAAPDAEAFTLGDPGGAAGRYRATLEGVAFVERLGYERLAALGAVPDRPILASGGGSASEVWNQIRATVLGRPLDAVPAATTALGAAILAAAGTLHPDVTTAARAMAVTGHRIEPDEGERAALDDSYRRFIAEITRRGWQD